MSFAIDRSKIKTYVISILVPVLLGAVVGFIIAGPMDYETLQKPALSPPGVVFPVVWTILYVLMGFSFGRLKNKGLASKDISTIYYAQLIVNLLWSVIFFVLKWRFFAFIWIVGLAVLVIVMAVKFYRKDKIAGLLQIPYIVWVLFASYLNFSIYLLNR